MSANSSITITMYGSFTASGASSFRSMGSLGFHSGSLSGSPFFSASASLRL